MESGDKAGADKLLTDAGITLPGGGDRGDNDGDGDHDGGQEETTTNQ
jgi:hypothetical protein